MSYANLWKEPIPAAPFRRLRLKEKPSALIDRWPEFDSIRFVEPHHKEFAMILTRRGIAWQYKPRTFAIDWDKDGNLVDCLTPDFYLSNEDIYLVLADRRAHGPTEKSVRLLRLAYPSVRVRLLKADQLDDAGLIRSPSGGVISSE